jgi:hypothetical protein
VIKRNQLHAEAREVAQSSADQALAAAEAIDPTRVPIQISVNEHNVNDAVIEGLRRATAIYTRNHQLVEVLWTDDELGQGPAIRPLTASRTREIITTVCQFLKRKDNQLVVAHPPDWCVAAVHGRGVWPTVRPIVGVLESPSLRPDGSIIQDAGYDAATGYVLVPSAEFPRVPERPTQEDARRALGSLCEVFCDFPHATRADLFVIVACIFTVLARPAIRGAVPAFVVRATTPGSGKGLQIDAIGMIAHGRPPAKMAFPSKEEEREKVLGAYALRGAGIICFDNLASGLGGAALDRCLTAIDTVELRILGKSEIPELKWRSVITATGNNPEYFGDTPRRILQSSLEPAEENPEERDEKTFKHHPLLPWVCSQRAQLVTHALTILRAHALAGRPRAGCRMWGSFEAWSEIIPPAIVWAGGADPMLTRPVLDATADNNKQAAAEFLRCWAELDRERQGLTTAEFLRKLYPGDRRDLDESELFTEARAATESLCRVRSGKAPDTSALGYALRKLRRRTIAGRRIDIVSRGQGMRRWVVETVKDSGDGAHGGDIPVTPREKVNGSNGSTTSHPSSPSPPADGDLSTRPREEEVPGSAERPSGVSVETTPEQPTFFWQSPGGEQ